MLRRKRMKTHRCKVPWQGIYCGGGAACLPHLLKGNETVRTVYVIQKPKEDQTYDFASVEALGEVNYILPAAPNLYDEGRMASDYERIVQVLEGCKPEDIFIHMGGSPFSSMMFGAAVSDVGIETINLGLYSRDVDQDGRRLSSGRYRIIPTRLYFEEKVADDTSN
jgi:hypothetical protein